MKCFANISLPPKTAFPLAAMLFLGVQACEPSAPSTPTDTNTDSTSEDTGTNCTLVLAATIRDFSDAHPDFEREDQGWGPARGLVQNTLSADRKPVFKSLLGDCRLTESGTCPVDVASLTPMWGILVDGEWQAEETFNTWYRDNDDIGAVDWYSGDIMNYTYLRDIPLHANPAKPGSFVFDSNQFFPLEIEDGFGETPATAGANYLFTTEIHTEFIYVQGQDFTFRGDDDLWIFVNDNLALDLGGLHVPYEGSINFDAHAEEYGIVPGNRYKMDIFHAERHTTQSNFRIETNIECFVPIVVE